MPSNKRKRKTSGSRRVARRQPQRSWLSRYGLLVGVAVFAVAVVAVLVVLDQRAASSDAAPNGDDAPLDKALGAKDAPVVVMEYADFQCPYCKQFTDGPGRQLKAEYVDPGLVRFVYRHYAFLGDESTWAAEASECAEERGRFWDYHDKLFVEQGTENAGAFARDNLKRFAAELGLDTEQFNTCFDTGRYRSQVQAERAEAQRRRIGGTPTLLVNGQLIQNGASYQVLKGAIETALANSD